MKVLNLISTSVVLCNQSCPILSCARMVKSSLQCNLCPKKVSTGRQLEKHVQKEHANDTPEDDDVMIVDQEEENAADDLGRPSVNRLLNISNENLPDEKIAATPEKVQVDKIEEEHKDEESVEEDDDIVVVKANIFNFQGKLSSYEEELENNIFSFKTYDDHNEEVLIAGEDDSEEETDTAGEIEEEPEEIILFQCDYCEQKFLHESNLSEHIARDHPPKPTQVKQFNNGCFFIMSG